MTRLHTPPPLLSPCITVYYDSSSIVSCHVGRYLGRAFHPLFQNVANPTCSAITTSTRVACVIALLPPWC